MVFSLEIKAALRHKCIFLRNGHRRLFTHHCRFVQDASVKRGYYRHDGVIVFLTFCFKLTAIEIKMTVIKIKGNLYSSHLPRRVEAQRTFQ